MADMISNPDNYAAIYARQSNLSNKIDSLHTQLLKGQEKALKNNLLVYKNYEEKISATEIPYDKREKFKELIDDAKAGYFKTLIVFKRDRLARKTEDFLKIKTLFKNLNISIIYSNENEFHSDGSPTSDFIENVIAAVSELEPNTIKERTSTGRKKKRENKEYSSGKTPSYGFIQKKDLNNTNSRYITYYAPDECKAKFIRKLFYYYNSNENIISASDLYNSLKENNIEIPSDFSKEKIRNILFNPIYADLQLKNLENKFKDCLFKDDEGNFSYIDRSYFHSPYNVEKIIDEETWYTAANKWFYHHNPFKVIKRNTNYLFKDLLFCEKCNNKITLSNKVYTCRTAGCTRLNENYLTNEILKQIIEDLIFNNKLNEQINSNMKVLKNKIQFKNHQLVQLTRKQELLVKSYLTEKDNNYTINALDTNVQSQNNIKKEIKTLNHFINYFEEMKTLSYSKFNKVSINSMINVMLTKQHLTQKYLLEIIEKVTIYGKNSNITKQHIHYK